MKRIVIITVLVVFIIIGCGTIGMLPTETGNVLNTNIYAIKNSKGAVFLLKTDNSSYIMFDSGSNYKNLETSLKNAEIDPNDVKWIFLTHSDSDHSAGLPLFPNAKIHISEDELQLINGKTKRSIFGGNHLPSGIDIDTLILLSDEQKMLLDGTEVECIKAPGHTNGSMVYLVAGQYLFTGDAFGIKKGKIIVHPFTMDKQLAEKTIERLKNQIDNCSIVLTYHYGIMVN